MDVEMQDSPLVNANSASLYRSSSKDQNKLGLTVEGWSFALSPLLENGALTLAPDEKIISEWDYVSTKLSQKEFFVCLLTFGIYYLYTRCYIRRRRRYKLVVTDSRVIIKEEMFETQGFTAITKKLIENQVTFPLSSLRYVCTEQMSEKLCGLIPPTVVLEIHFLSSPSWQNLPPLSYYGSFELLKRAFVVAFKNVYGVDLLASALVKIAQIVINKYVLEDPSQAVNFAFSFMYNLMIEFLKMAREMISVFSQDPIVGSRQVVGELNPGVFRWEVDNYQDPQCKEHMYGILKALSGQLKRFPVVPPSINMNLHKSIKINNSFDSPDHLNGRVEYGNYKGFSYYDNLFPLQQGDMIRDVSPDNPVFTWNDVMSIINSFGYYYFAEVHNKLTNWTTNFYVTDTSIIRQQVIISPAKNRVQYARADVWINGACEVLHIQEGNGETCGVQSNNNNSFIGGSKFYSIDLEIRSLKFGNTLLKYMTSGIVSYEHKLCAITNLSEINIAPFTQMILHSNERVDSLVKSSPIDPCYNYLICCGMNITPNDILTVTNFGLYIETYNTSWLLDQCQLTKQQRKVSFFSWSQIKAFYWSNFESKSFGCPIFCCTDPFLCLNFVGCTACLGCCPFCFSGDRNFHPHGCMGTRLMVLLTTGVDDKAGYFGINVPRQYYAQSESKLNAAVDTASLRNYIYSRDSLSVV